MSRMQHGKSRTPTQPTGPARNLNRQPANVMQSGRPLVRRTVVPEKVMLIVRLDYYAPTFSLINSISFM